MVEETVGGMAGGMNKIKQECCQGQRDIIVFLAYFFIYLCFELRYVLNADGKSCREVGIPWSLDDYSFIKSNISVYNYL
ncbi:MAG: hypothetical protein A4E56_01659 [Pelotomaculum sp. PtaU1.Bin065]|nr:MAG: hypothetical protein A4E56_01659 [Pelotomaculum sp. PtaU1.Bin065]